MRGAFTEKLNDSTHHPWGNGGGTLRIDQATDVCRECHAQEIKQAVAKGHPEPKRGQLFERVQEWVRIDPDWRH